MKLTFGSLFSGIGGFDLGFTRAGLVCKWQVEIDDYCQRVLAKHWPEVKRYGDIRELDGSELEYVDVLCGGFPCQPHSLAGKRLASADERDLWGDFVRIIRAVRPHWIVAENVSGLLSSEDGRFFGRVLRDLAASGYDAEWDVLSAAAFGAPQMRERVILVAYPNGRRCEADFLFTQGSGNRGRKEESAWSRSILARGTSGRVWGIPDGGIRRVANGVSSELDRFAGLGNAIVPQVAEWIARRIVAAEEVV
jgi:DNA (cytosine-5)-methyltransferase 1